jgi:hypothetical protein
MTPAKTDNQQGNPPYHLLFKQITFHGVPGEVKTSLQAVATP